ncbi:MAG: hypothetical protein ACYTBJ_00040 [Planctomycetota bacterium]|jgi:hypothetical protein
MIKLTIEIPADSQGHLRPERAGITGINMDYSKNNPTIAIMEGLLHIAAVGHMIAYPISHHRDFADIATSSWTTQRAFSTVVMTGFGVNETIADA